MLTTVPYYCIGRDEDGRPSREFNRQFTLALRWQPEMTIAAEMVSATSKKLGEPPVHAGCVALKLLRDANDISQRQLEAAICYLDDAVAYYRSAGDEPYPGRNVEAIGDLQSLLLELTGRMR